MAYDFYMPARVVGGENVVVKQSALLKKFGSSCLIVTGGTGAKKSGALDDVVTALKEQNIKYEIYDKIGENPLVTAC